MTKKEESTKHINQCKYCHNDLKWGKFAYEQDTCWDCFISQFRQIQDSAKKLALLTHREQKILNHIMAVFAEAFGEKW